MSLGKQSANLGVFIFLFSLERKKHPAQQNVLEEQRKCLHYAYLHFSRSTGAPGVHTLGASSVLEQTFVFEIRDF